MDNGYVHGYREPETARLADQATTLRELLHHDTAYGPGERVLEAGCGVGAQTEALVASSPGAHITAVDVSETSLAAARKRLAAAPAAHVEFCRADIFELPFAPGSFDHVFVCFVLEHLANPVQALERLGRVLRPGGSLTVIEGDHGSTYFSPDSRVARAAVACQVRLQRLAGGNANIGRELYPLLVRAGFAQPQVSPRMVYVDGARPHLAEGFTRRTFTAMIRGVREQALARGLTGARDFDQGIADLERAAEPDGVFCYTFFKGVAQKPDAAGRR